MAMIPRKELPKGPLTAHTRGRNVLDFEVQEESTVKRSRLRFGGTTTGWVISDRFDRLLPPHKRYFGRSRRTLLIAITIIFLLLLGLIIGLVIGLTKKSKPRSLPLPNGGERFTGDITYYDPGLGACGISSTAKDDIVSISHYTFDAVQTGSDPNQNPLCGRKVRAQRVNNGETVSIDLTVVDRCTGCQPTDIDVSPAAFDKLADHDLVTEQSPTQPTSTSPPRDSASAQLGLRTSQIHSPLGSHPPTAPSGSPPATSPKSIPSTPASTDGVRIQLPPTQDRDEQFLSKVPSHTFPTSPFKTVPDSSLRDPATLESQHLSAYPGSQLSAMSESAANVRSKLALNVALVAGFIGCGALGFAGYDFYVIGGLKSAHNPQPPGNSTQQADTSKSSETGGVDKLLTSLATLSPPQATLTSRRPAGGSIPHAGTTHSNPAAVSIPATMGSKPVTAFSLTDGDSSPTAAGSSAAGASSNPTASSRGNDESSSKAAGSSAAGASSKQTASTGAHLPTSTNDGEDAHPSDADPDTETGAVTGGLKRWIPITVTMTETDTPATVTPIMTPRADSGAESGHPEKTGTTSPTKLSTNSAGHSSVASSTQHRSTGTADVKASKSTASPGTDVHTSKATDARTVKLTETPSADRSSSARSTSSAECENPSDLPNGYGCKSSSASSSRVPSVFRHLTLGLLLVNYRSFGVHAADNLLPEFSDVSPAKAHPQVDKRLPGWEIKVPEGIHSVIHEAKPAENIAKPAENVVHDIHEQVEEAKPADVLADLTKELEKVKDALQIPLSFNALPGLENIFKMPDITLPDDLNLTAILTDKTSGCMELLPERSGWRWAVYIALVFVALELMATTFVCGVIIYVIVKCKGIIKALLNDDLDGLLKAKVGDIVEGLGEKLKTQLLPELKKHFTDLTKPIKDFPDQISKKVEELLLGDLQASFESFGGPGMIFKGIKFLMKKGKRDVLEVDASPAPLIDGMVASDNDVLPTDVVKPLGANSLTQLPHRQLALHNEQSTALSTLTPPTQTTSGNLFHAATLPATTNLLSTISGIFSDRVVHLNDPTTTATQSSDAKVIMASHTTTTGSPIMSPGTSLTSVASATSTGGAGSLSVLPVFALLAWSYKSRRHKQLPPLLGERAEPSHNYLQAYGRLYGSIWALCNTVEDSSDELATLTKTKFSCDTFDETFSAGQSDVCNAKPSYERLKGLGDEYCGEVINQAVGETATTLLESKIQFCELVGLFGSEWDVGGCESATSVASNVALPSSTSFPSIQSTQQTGLAQEDVTQPADISLVTSEASSTAAPMSTQSLVSGSVLGASSPANDDVTGGALGVLPSHAKITPPPEWSSVSMITYATQAKYEASDASSNAMATGGGQPPAWTGPALARTWADNSPFPIPTGYVSPNIVPSEPQIGHLTYFNSGMGACGDPAMTENELAAAISWEIYDLGKELSGTDMVAKYSGQVVNGFVTDGTSLLCNRRIKVWMGEGHEVEQTFVVRDRCTACNTSDIDIQPGIYSRYWAPQGVGRVSVTWQWQEAEATSAA